MPTLPAYSNMLHQLECEPAPAYPAKIKRSATVNGWTVEINAETLHGWFERHLDGAGGDLTFVHAQDPETLEDVLELVDYDGVFALPKPVYEQLKAWDILMEDVFNPDYEV